MIKILFLLTFPFAYLIGTTTSSAAEISYSGIVATVEKTEEGISITVENSGFSELLPVGARLGINQDGIFSSGPDGELNNLFSVRSLKDADWLNVKSHIEMMRVEVPSVEMISDHWEGIPLVYRLAFRAGLDNSARTALDAFEEQGVSFVSIMEPDWEFDPDNPRDRARVIRSLDILGEAMNGEPLRVSGSAANIYLGYPVAEDRADMAPILWPRQEDYLLRLAPNQSGDPYAVFEIGDRLLTGRPDWFKADDRIDNTEQIGCLPFGGCGYLDADAVLPVQPIWITFDRSTLLPLVVTVE